MWLEVWSEVRLEMQSGVGLEVWLGVGLEVWLEKVGSDEREVPCIYVPLTGCRFLL